MLKKSKVVALLAVCVMMFAAVEPALAWGNRTGSQTGDAVAYGAGTGAVAAIGAAALIFFTGGLATPLVIGAAAAATAAGAAGGAYYGYNVEEKSLAKDAAVIVGGGVAGAGAVAAAPVVGGVATTLTGGLTVGEITKTAVGQTIDEAKKHPIAAVLGLASGGKTLYEGAQLLSAIFVKSSSDENTESARKLDEKLQKLAKEGKKVELKKVELPTRNSVTAYYTVDGVEHVETFNNK